MKQILYFRTFFLIATIFLTNSASSLILIRPNNISQSEFEIALRHQEEHISWLDYKSKNTMDSKLSEQLLSLFEQAQIHVLENRIEKSRLFFEKIKELQHVADWNIQQIQTIQFSILKLAELDSNKTSKFDLMLQAFMLSPENEIDQNVFAESTVKEYSKAINVMNQKIEIWQPYSQLPKGSIVILNGRKLKVTPELKVRLFPMLQRITILTDFSPPLTILEKANEILWHRFEFKPFSKGSCQYPEIQFLPEENFQQIAFWYSNSCIKENQFSKTTHKDSTEPYDKLNWPTTGENFENGNVEKQSIFKNKWVWGAFVFITSGALIYNHNNVVIHKKVIKTGQN
jgi:hypothetical protein